MEPIDLNPSDSADRSLEAMLRANAGEPLPDAGFSARVVAELPPKPERFFGAREWLGTGVLAALALIFGPGDLGETARAETVSLGSAFAPLFTALTNPTLMLVLAITAGTWLLVSDEEEAAPGSTSAP